MPAALIQVTAAIEVVATVFGKQPACFRARLWGSEDANGRSEPETRGEPQDVDGGFIVPHSGDSPSSILFLLYNTKYLSYSVSMNMIFWLMLSYLLLMP